MGLMFKCQIDKHIKLHQICTPPKLTQSKMNESAEQAAFVVSLVEEVKAVVPIPDDTLQDMFVRPYIENDVQVHLEICSVLVRRSNSFSPQDLAVLKGLMDSHCGPHSIPIIDARSKLESHKASVGEQEFSLIMTQLTYGADVWRLHKHT